MFDKMARTDAKFRSDNLIKIDKRGRLDSTKLDKKLDKIPTVKNADVKSVNDSDKTVHEMVKRQTALDSVSLDSAILVNRTLLDKLDSDRAKLAALENAS